jgi:hypothetical protein
MLTRIPTETAEFGNLKIPQTDDTLPSLLTSASINHGNRATTQQRTSAPPEKDRNWSFKRPSNFPLPEKCRQPAELTLSQHVVIAPCRRPSLKRRTTVSEILSNEPTLTLAGLEGQIYTIHRVNKRNEVAEWNLNVANIKRLSVQQSFLFHSYAVVGASYMMANSDSTVLQATARSIWLEQQKLYIEAMQQALQLYAGIPSDEQCLAALTICLIIGSVNQEVDTIHPKSPFAYIDTSYFNSGVTVDPRLHKYWKSLIDRKGGIPEIKNPVMYVVLFLIKPVTESSSRQCHER